MLKWSDFFYCDSPQAPLSPQFDPVSSHEISDIVALVHSSQRRDTFIEITPHSLLLLLLFHNLQEMNADDDTVFKIVIEDEEGMKGAKGGKEFVIVHLKVEHTTERNKIVSVISR